MDIPVDETAALSSSERMLRQLETRSLDSELTILGRALLLSAKGDVNEAAMNALLALPASDLAQLAAQHGIQTGT